MDWLFFYVQDHSKKIKRQGTSLWMRLFLSKEKNMNHCHTFVISQDVELGHIKTKAFWRN